MTLITNQETLLKLINNAKGGNSAIVTNFFIDAEKTAKWIKEKALSAFESKNGLLIFRHTEGFCHLYYYASDIHKLGYLLQEYPTADTLVIDLIDRESNIPALSRVLEANGFSLHRILQRYSRINQQDSNYYEKDSTVEIAYYNDAGIIAKKLRLNFDSFSEQIPNEQDVAELIREQKILVIRIGDDIAGFLIRSFTGQHSILNNFLVDTNYRGQGIGSKLLKYYIAEAEASKRMVLWVVSDNDTAKAVYEQHGYSKDGLMDYIYIRHNK